MGEAKGMAADAEREAAMAVLKRVRERVPTLVAAEGVYIGNLATAMNFDCLKRHGITHIVCCARNVGRTFPKYRRSDDFAYFDVELLDTDSQLIDVDTMKAALVFISEAIAAKSSVLVHCVQGVSRSGAVVCAYLMKSKGWSFEEALHAARQSRPSIRPNDNFAKQLKIMSGLL